MLAFLTPLPPARSGIASYSLMLAPHLAKRHEISLVVDQDEVADSAGLPFLFWHEFEARRGEFDLVFAHIGNNPHHERFYRYAMENPCIVVLHDLVLHHLIVEMTLARGDVDGYVRALESNHGEAGAAWARGRASGLHSEIGNFLFPASLELANRSRHVIVHNHYAASTLREGGVTTPITVVPHPIPPVTTSPATRTAIRQRHAIGPDERVLAMFGFVTAAKRPEIVFRAFGEAARRDRRLRLLVVGEPAPNIDVDRLAADAGVERSRVTAVGYVSDEEFASYLSAVDKVVNLRYPSAGETSGALMHVIAAGVDAAVSDYGPFSEIPDGVVTKVPLGDGEVEALVAFMLASGGKVSADERSRFIARCDVERIVDGFLAAGNEQARHAARPRLPARHLPLFTQWETRHSLHDGVLRIELRNGSERTLRSPLYGEPAYRLIVRGFSDDAELFDRWLSPGGDCAPRESFVFELSVPAETRRVLLFDAAEAIPSIEPFAVLELA